MTSAAPEGHAYAHSQDGRITVVVTGEVDMLTTPHLDDVLTAAVRDAETGVDVDLGKVEFLASTGLRSLVAAKQAADIRGVPLRVVRASEVAQRVLEMAALDSLFSS